MKAALMHKFCGPRLASFLLNALLLFCLPTLTLAQTNDSYNAERQRAIQLTEDSKFTEAMPLLEKLAGVNPSDAEVQFRLGFAILANAKTIKDAAMRKGARVPAHRF
jgi:hypothetical protein